MNQSAVEFDESELQRCKPVEMVGVYCSEKFTDRRLALFCGHTHQPYVRELRQGSIRVKVQQRDQGAPTEQELELPMRRIVNAGSVGEPRHGSTKATYVIHNDNTGEVTIREVDYDVAKTCRAIVDAGLPEVFAWRLSHGFEYAERAEDASHVCER